MAWTSNFPLVAVRLRELPKASRRAVVRGFKRGLEFARTLAQRDYLSGPRPVRLDVVTARLRNSIAIKVRDNGAAIDGTIGTNVKYARYHELGFQGVQTVRRHRRIRGVVLLGGKLNLAALRGPIREARYDAGGRLIAEGRIVGYKRRLGSLAKELKAAGAIVQRQRIGSYQRRLAYSGRPFLRPALLRSEADIALEIKTELHRHARRVNHGHGGVA